MPDASPLVLSNVTKTYGKNRGIQDVSFSLQKGEIFGFLGPNGAGKTTTIRTILNFLKPTQGSISIFGQDSVKDSVHIKHNIGYLAGNFAPYENLTGSQLLTFLGSINGGLNQEYVNQLVSRFDAELKRPLKQLSKGNRQKIGIIQAFMHKPELIILDEPTSGLDPLMQERFYQTITEAKEAGATLLISSHNLAEVQRICSRAAFIREGQIISIEDINHTRQLAISKFFVTFAVGVKPDNFKNIEAIQEMQIDGKSGNFTVQGNMDAFVKALAKCEVESMQVEQASLEDMFMSLYESENKS